MNDLHQTLGVSHTATPVEQEARRLLSRNTPEDTNRAKQVLLDGRGDGQSAEWYFLMGICALRRGYIADSQAHLDRACALCPAETEYSNAYESIRLSLRRKNDDGSQPEGKFHGGLCDSSFCLDGCGECCCEVGCDRCGDGGCDGCCGDGCDCGDCCN